MSERYKERGHWGRHLKQSITIAAAAVFVPIAVTPFLLGIVHLFFDASPYATATFNKGEFVGMVGAIAGGVATIAAIIMTTKQNDEAQDAVVRERVVGEIERLFGSFTDNITHAMAEMETMLQTCDQMMIFAGTHDAMSEFIRRHADDEKMRAKAALCKTLQPLLVSWTLSLSEKIDFERYNGCLFVAYRRAAAIADKAKEIGSDEAFAFAAAVVDVIETLVNDPKEIKPTQDLLDEATSRFAALKLAFLAVEHVM